MPLLGSCQVPVCHPCTTRAATPAHWHLVMAWLCAQIALCAVGVAVGTDVEAAPVATVEPWGTDAVRVRVSAPGNSAKQEPIVGALLPDPPAPRGHGPALVSESGLEVTNGNLKVVVDEKTGFLTATRVSDGVVLLRQTGLEWGATSTPKDRKGSVSAAVTFAGHAGEQVYGFGEHKNQKVQQMPYQKKFADSLYYGYSQGGDVSIPYYSSSLGYGFVWNSPSLGSVSVSESEIEWVSNATLGVDMWISTTPAHCDMKTNGTASRSYLLDLLHSYVDAVGHATPMPFWTTGFIQCKDRYRNQTQVLDVARGYVERGLPISMIVIDWFHWNEMGDWQMKKECWPDPKAMVDELRGMGIELMVTFWPFMGMNRSIHWQEYLDNGYLAVNLTTGSACSTLVKDGTCGDNFWRYNTPTNNALVDSTNPKGMARTFEHWWEGYGQYGVRAMWMDESEPDHAAYISGGQWDLFAGTDAEILPAWVHYWIKGISDGMNSIGAAPGEYFILSRNAWAGTWSYGGALWSGDIGSNWHELETAVTVGQGASMSGVALWTTDIGGYAGGNPDSPSFQQMIVRWFQFGAFCPLFRLHGHRGGESAKANPPTEQCAQTNGDNEVWNLAQQTDHYDAIVAVMELRETLRNYVAKINNDTVMTGVPMMRPMFVEFPADAECYEPAAEAQFMLGPDWLIAPVTAENATSWPAYLPKIPPVPTGTPGEKSHEWVYWWNQSVVQEGQWVTVDTTALKDFPLFYKRPL